MIHLAVHTTAPITQAAAMRQRQQTYTQLKPLVPPLLPARITLIRFAPRGLKAEHVPAALRGSRAGVQDWIAGRYLGGQEVMDIRWEYEQRGSRRPGEYSVGIIYEHGKG